MSEQNNKKKSTAKWTTAQTLGFWFLLTATVFGWGGVYLGNLSANLHQQDMENAKTQAVEAYKASATSKE